MEKKKIKGLIPAIIIWGFSSLDSAFTMINRFMAIGESYESVSDCVITGIRYFIYFIAFVLGLIYLFKKDKKYALGAAIIYALAKVYTVIDELISGYYSNEGMIFLLIDTIAYIFTVLIIKNLIEGKEAKSYGLSLKFWYMPSLVLLLSGLIQSIITEINDTRGFDFSLVIVDVVLTIILLLPMYIMTSVIKEDSKN